MLGLRGAGAALSGFIAGSDARVCAVVDLALGGAGEDLVCVLELARGVMIINMMNPLTSSTLLIFGLVRMVCRTGRLVCDLNER